MLDEELRFDCPYCQAAMSVRVDITEGSRQNFVYDCETCCRPIHMEVRLDVEGAVESFEALAENES